MMRRLVTFVLVGMAMVAHAYTERNLLQQRADESALASLVVMERGWVDYPAYNDRAAWEAFFGEYREHYIRQGEKLLDYAWQNVRATDYLAFDRTGDRKTMENPCNGNYIAITSLLLAELAEGEGRFVDQLIDGVFHICQMNSWALSAHLIRQPSGRALPSYDYPVIDLMAGDVGGILAWVHYFMHDSFDAIDPEIDRYLCHELRTRVVEPYIDLDFWWTGRNYNGRVLNTWHPWCNSYVLMTAMLIEDDPAAMAHIAYLTMQSEGAYVNYIKGEGGCEEGPSYWGHAAGKLLDYLDLLAALTAQRVTIYDEPMIRRVGEYYSCSYVGNG